jgi:hypothetical protein
MKLLILNGPPDARAAKYPLYRGTCRAHPAYCELLPLWWGLEPQPGLETVPEPIRELVGLVYRYYAPKLNRQGLFLTPEVASQCLSSMDALQRLSPNLYEGEDLIPTYRVVGVYLV